MNISLDEEYSRHLLEILISKYDAFILQREIMMHAPIAHHDEGEHKKFVSTVENLNDRIYILARLILKIGSPLKKNYGVNEEIDAILRGVNEFVNTSVFTKQRDLDSWWAKRVASHLKELGQDFEASLQLRTSDQSSPKDVSKPERGQDTPPY